MMVYFMCFRFFFIISGNALKLTTTSQVNEHFCPPLCTCTMFKPLKQMKHKTFPTRTSFRLFVNLYRVKRKAMIRAKYKQVTYPALKTKRKRRIYDIRAKIT